MDKPLLDEIIIKMEEKGFDIHGIILDLGNQRLLKELGFYDKNYFCFPNPADPTLERRVRIFPDAPHMLKLARSHLFDQGFLIPLSNGRFTLLTKEDIHSLLETHSSDSSDLRILSRLTEAHFNCVGSQRQNVRLAAQVLSHSVAKAMTYNKPEDEELKAKSDVIKLFNDWFDVCNSSGRFNQNLLKNPLGTMHIEEQMHVLNKMEKFLHEFKVNGNHKNQYWVKGILANIHSTRALHRDLVTNGPFSYIITRRLNQDFLENFFSRLRAIGGDNCHPGPYTMLRRVRTLLIGKQADIIVQRSSVAIEEITAPEQIPIPQPSTSSVEQEEDEFDGFEDPPEDLGVYRDANNEVDKTLNVTEFVTKDLETSNMEEHHDPETMEDIPNFENTEIYTDGDEDIDLAVKEFQILAKEDTSFQGLSYLAGYIAFKFKNEFPQLGDKTNTFPSHDPNGNRYNYITTWIFHVSKGGLMVPDSKFLSYCQLFEQEFLKFHGQEGINREDRILDKLTQILFDKFGKEFDKKVLAFFVKVRTYIRIKTMILDARKSNKNPKGTRDYKQQAQFATSHSNGRQEIVVENIFVEEMPIGEIAAEVIANEEIPIEETVIEESISDPATGVIFAYPNFFYEEHVSTTLEEDG